jgi:DNA-binding NarL/FixJ family response regulator
MDVEQQVCLLQQPIAKTLLAGVHRNREEQPVRMLISGRRADGRAALALFLEHRPSLEVVAEAADVQTLLTRAEATQPDMVLLDWDLCDRPLEDLVSALHQLESRPGVILTNAAPESKQEALDAGAGAFVARGEDPRSLLLAIEKVRLERQEQWATRRMTPA